MSDFYWGRVRPKHRGFIGAGALPRFVTGVPGSSPGSLSGYRGKISVCYLGIGATPVRYRGIGGKLLFVTVVSLGVISE